MNITGKCMIFSNDKGYSTTISRKNQNGEFERMYISVQLPKDIKLENKTYIDITKGFLSFYNTKEGLPKVKIVVMQYNTEQKEEEYIINNTDLPF